MGGAAHPDDPLLACAVWSVFWGPQDPRNGAGQVFGAQTAQRGELEAVTRAAEQRRGLLDVGTDSQFVVDGMVKLGRGRDLSDEVHGDLWERLRAAGGGTEVVTHKVPAHQPRPDPPRLTVADWAGNAAADAAATAALRRLVASRERVRARGEALRAAAAAQAVLGAVQEAVLRRDHAYEGGVPRVPRGRRPRAPEGPLGRTVRRRPAGPPAAAAGDPPP